MQRRVGKGLMLAGIILILSALSLLLYNTYDSFRAGNSAENMLSKVKDAITDNVGKIERPGAIHTPKPSKNEDGNQDVDDEMTEVEIDGYDYIGYLSMPTLEMELPIMSEWDYARLKIAPCRQFGTARGHDLVLAGHNYRRHFGRLAELALHDPIIFTDMDGNRFYYEVGVIDVLPPMSVDKVKDSEWELVLYTCTYGGRTRVTVYCALTSEP